MTDMYRENIQSGLKCNDGNHSATPTHQSWLLTQIRPYKIGHQLLIRLDASSILFIRNYESCMCTD